VVPLVGGLVIAGAAVGGLFARGAIVGALVGAVDGALSSRCNSVSCPGRGSGIAGGNLLTSIVR
jgi:hypothetical protein